ncbi:MAG: DUF63 family protein [Candidatus ainarchaeum sp.]|nr:DUF63 family protein [Candidatus ainarchaeum sp.]
MSDFITDFFINPIAERTGYNLVNTLLYAVLAIAAIYVIWLAFRKFKIRIGDDFFYGVLSFVLFGSTARVVTDAVDAGTLTAATPLHQLVLGSGIYQYGFLTVSPGIYVVVASLLLVCVAILHHFQRMGYLKYIGLALFAFHFLLLLPFLQYWMHAIPVLIMAIIPFAIAYHYFRDTGSSLVVGAQALDGAATFYIIDIFSPLAGMAYFEQHVISRAVGEFMDTYLLFYLVKIAIAFAAAYFVGKEKMPMDEKRFILLIFIIIGLAPGLRDLLRMMAGT